MANPMRTGVGARQHSRAHCGGLGGDALLCRRGLRRVWFFLRMLRRICGRARGSGGRRDVLFQVGSVFQGLRLCASSA